MSNAIKQQDPGATQQCTPAGDATIDGTQEMIDAIAEPWASESDCDEPGKLDDYCDGAALTWHCNECNDADDPYDGACLQWTPQGNRETTRAALPRAQSSNVHTSEAHAVRGHCKKMSAGSAEALQCDMGLNHTPETGPVPNVLSTPADSGSIPLPSPRNRLKVKTPIPGIQVNPSVLNSMRGDLSDRAAPSSSRFAA